MVARKAADEAETRGRGLQFRGRGRNHPDDAADCRLEAVGQFDHRALAAAAEEAAANVGTVAAAAEELGASVREIGRQVQGSTGLALAVEVICWAVACSSVAEDETIPTMPPTAASKPSASR
jgi:hypothetical protein